MVKILKKFQKLDKNQLSRDHHVIDHFRTKSIVFRDTRYNQEHDAKVRLSILSPSSEKPKAEIIQLKKSDLMYFKIRIVITW